MSDTLAAVLDLLLPGLDPRLLPPESTAWIRPLAERLPPARLGGFEVRLSPASPRVDFQVAWRRDEAEALAEAARGLGCAALEEFARDWDPAFDEVWLEFDEGCSLPCVFLGTDVDAFPPEAARRAMHEAAARLAPGTPCPGMDELFAACRGPQRVSHLGLMLSRAMAGVRLNVKRVAPGECAALLARAGLPEAGAPTLPPGFDRHVLAVDLPGGTWGLECGLRDPCGPWPWEAVVPDGEVRAALEGWPHVLHPGNTGPWPACLILPALAAPARHLPVLERRVGHVKVGPPAAVKAYLGFMSGVLGHDSARAAS